jgi:5,5'-dehydrodivanillate O-demethylase oxygenase subunit
MRETQAFLPDFARVENGALAGKWLASFWQPIALSRDYAAGKARRIKILGTHYTLYRGQDGGMRLTQDRCPHRGTSLAYGWVEGNGIRCRYHGWKFDGTGRGEEFPAETASFAAKICLKSYATREYHGLVFGYFGEGDPPKMWTFPELEDEAQGEVLAQEVLLPYNYFQRIENDHDEVHAHYTHKFMSKFGLSHVPRMSARETDYGMTSIATYPDGSRFEAHGFMPNILLRHVPIPQDLTKMAVHLAYRVPIDDVSTLSFTVNRVGASEENIRQLAEAQSYEELTRQVMDCEIALDDIDPTHPLLPIIQDTVSIGGQGTIAHRELEHLGRSDIGVAMMRRIWEREMKAIRDGAPLKEWRRPEDFSFEERALESVQ